LTILPHEWTEAENIFITLKPFYTSTVLLSVQDKPTTHKAYMVISVLRKHINKYFRHQSTALKDAAQAMETKFLKYFDDIPLFVVIAHILDPQYKLEYILTESIVSHATYKKEFEDFFASFYAENTVDNREYASATTVNAVNLPQIDQSDPFAVADNAFATRRTHSTPSQKNELEDYLTSPILPRKQDFDILAYWRVHSHL